MSKKLTWDEVINDTKETFARWNREITPELRKLRSDFSEVSEKLEREKFELVSKLSSKQKKLRESIVGFKSVGSKLADYSSVSRFASDKELREYIRDGNERLKPFMDDLVKHSEIELSAILTKREWSWLGYYYTQYKERGVVPLLNTAIY